LKEKGDRKRREEMGVFKETLPLPDSVSLSHIAQSIPKEAYEKNDLKAIRALLITSTTTAFGMFLIHLSPLWLLPLVWLYAGTAATGLFVIGHDCGHRSFMKSMFWNNLIGTITFTPLLYPFHAWRIQHNVHHNNTNKLHVDTAWQPVPGNDYLVAGPVLKFAHRMIRGPMWFTGSIGHWVYEHFNMALFKGEDLEKVKSSTAFLTYFILTFFPLLYYFSGLWGIVKFWFVPWLVFHFWMSTFTLVHHTAPHIPFLEASKWHDAVAAVQYTVHCRYPAWVDFLCHDISVHVPHHVSSAIPHYNLRLAYSAIRKNWEPYIQECEFGLELIWHIVTNCHIHDDETGLYKPFALFLKSVGLINPPSSTGRTM